MTERISWQPNELPKQVIRHLLEGRAVALPTESTYEIVGSALNPDSLSQVSANQYPALVLFDFGELFDWMPLLRGAGARLFRKLGAGSVTLRANGGYRIGLYDR